VDRFSEMVTRKAVSGMCRRWVIEPSSVSEAWKVRTTFRALERMRTEPLEEPRNKDSEPVARDITSFCHTVRDLGAISIGKSIRTSKT